MTPSLAIKAILAETDDGNSSNAHFPKATPKVKRKGYFGEKSLVLWDAILISRCGHPGLARAMARPHVHTCDLCVRAAVDA